MGAAGDPKGRSLGDPRSTGRPWALASSRPTSPPAPPAALPGLWPTSRSPSTWLRLRTTSTWQSPGAVQAPRARSRQVRGEPRRRAAPLGGGWQAVTRPLGTTAAPAPDGEPPHDPPTAPQARRADHGPARHSRGGPPGLCFREPDPRRHFGEDRPRAPLRPRTLLGGGAGPPMRGPERSGRVTGGRGSLWIRARAARTGGGEEASPTRADGAPGRSAGPALGESCCPPPAPAPAGRSDPRAPRAGRPPPLASFPQAPLPGSLAAEGPVRATHAGTQKSGAATGGPGAPAWT